MNILTRLQPIIGRSPAVGDPVWWATKQVGLVITVVHELRPRARRVMANLLKGKKDAAIGLFTIQGGPIIRNKKGREVPRWTVQTKALRWHPTAQMWVLGSGPVPRRENEIILFPEPVCLSGVAQGSFAPNKVM